MNFQILGYGGGSGMRRESSLTPTPPPPQLPAPVSLPLCLVLSVMHMSTGAFFTEPPPSQAWVGTRAEF